MIKKRYNYLLNRKPETAPVASRQLEAEGFASLPSVFTNDEVSKLQHEINRVFDSLQPDQRNPTGRSEADDNMFRYEMLNRSAACQSAVAHPGILEVIEPLLADDCHVIANTAWRNPAGHSDGHGGHNWHIDAGPHIPMPSGVSWPTDIPHPVFAIGVHILLQDCELADGPTGVLPGSHLSGRFPPFEDNLDDKLSFAGRTAVPLLGKAGDVLLFVSDVWHRRLPTGKGDQGRFFLQVHYGRRDIAQRIRTTVQINHLSAEAIERAHTTREQTLIGLHKPGFYDG